LRIDYCTRLKCDCLFHICKTKIMAILANVCLVRNYKRPLLELLFMQYEELVILQVWGTRIRMVRNAKYMFICVQQWKCFCRTYALFIILMISEGRHLMKWVSILFCFSCDPDAISTLQTEFQSSCIMSWIHSTYFSLKWVVWEWWSIVTRIFNTYKSTCKTQCKRALNFPVLRHCFNNSM
jgi:hypothetical protein